MSSFKEKMALGDIGETLVSQFLQDKFGYAIYRPQDDKVAHWIDIIAMDKFTDGMFAVEIKTKPKLLYYNATGINTRSHYEYLELQKKHNLDVMLFFVDADLKQIYYSKLSSLLIPTIYNEIQYPNFEILQKQNIVLFPLEEMEVVKNLTENEINLIKN